MNAIIYYTVKENKQFICITINTGQHKEMIQQILNSIYIDSSIDFNLNIMKKINPFQN